MVCISLLKVSLCSCIVFLSLFSCVSLVSCSSRSLFTMIIIHFFVRQFIDLYFLGSATGALLCSLVVVCFLDSSCFLKSCIAVFTFEEAVPYSSLYWLLQERRPSPVSPARDFGGLLGFFYGYKCPVSFALGVQVFRFFAFSQSCKARMGAERLPVMFSRAVPWICQDCALVLNPAELGWLPVSVCSPWGLKALSAQACVCHLRGCGYTLCGALCVWSQRQVWSAARVHWPAGGGCREGIPWAWQVALLMEYASHLGSVAIFWEMCGGCCERLTIFSAPRSFQSAPTLNLSVIWVGWSRGGLSRAMSARRRKMYTHLRSHFPHGRNVNERVSLGTELGHLGGKRGVQVEWTCTYYPHQCVFFWIFCSNRVLESLHCTPGFPQRFLHLWKVVKIDASVGVGRLDSPVLPSCWRHLRLLL